ncbi:MAG: RNA polymerase sigma-70 factor [Salinimicrobium sp.]
MGKDRKEIGLLVRQLRRGNEKAFEKLYEKYRDDIFTYSKALVRSQYAAEEIMQEVFLKLWLNAENLAPELSLRSYLFTICRNLSFDFLRKAANNRKLQQEIFFSVERTQVPQELLNQEYDLLKKRAISELPPKRRRIFEMSRNEGKTYSDISDELGISVSTVKTQMSEALQFLKKYLQLHTDLTFLLVLIIEFSGNSF